MRRILKTLTATLILMSASTAVAQNDVELTTSHSYTIPENQHRTWVQNSKAYLTVFDKNSYYCRGIGASINKTFNFRVESPEQKTISLKYRSLLPDSYGSLADKNAFSVIPASGLNSLEVTILQNGYSAGDTVGTIECQETTLFGSFNTIAAANPVNFLEITNLDSQGRQPTTVLVYINNYTGTEISSFQINSLAPSERRDIGIHDIAGAADTFGTIILTHDGIPGSIRANLSKYIFEGAQLRITATEPLKTK